MSVKIEKTQNNNELKLEFTIEAKKFDEGMKKVYKYKGEPFGYGSLGMKNVGEGIESFIWNIFIILRNYVLFKL